MKTRHPAQGLPPCATELDGRGSASGRPRIRGVAGRLLVVATLGLALHPGSAPSCSPTFGGLSVGTGWQDVELGVEHLTHWKKIALVTDVEWMIHLVRLFGWMTPGELRHFPLDERDAAIAWAAAD